MKKVFLFALAALTALSLAACQPTPKESIVKGKNLEKMIDSATKTKPPAATGATAVPAGATIAVITSTVSDPLLDSLSRLRQSGHAVALLLVSDQPMARRLAGIPVYHLGGSDTWRALTACYNQEESEQTPKEAERKEQPLAAFQL